MRDFFKILLTNTSNDVALRFEGVDTFTLSTEYQIWDGIVEYSIDRVEWVVWNGESTPSSKILYLRGTNNTRFATDFSEGKYTQFKFETVGQIKAYGRIDYLLDYKTVNRGEAPEMSEWCFTYLFYNCVALTQAPELPALELTSFCYRRMFRGCISLLYPPELPATTVEPYCYAHMFYGCEALLYPPELPATTLAECCYQFMFYGCTSLIESPELPATTVEPYCYNNMFYGCASLIELPELPAEIVVEACYQYMFANCISIVNLIELPAKTLVPYCYRSMFQDCISIKVSQSGTTYYNTPWKIPSSGTGSLASPATSWNSYMLLGTGGTYTSHPSINTTYYYA